MLEQMREGSKNGLTMVFFVIIAVVFAVSFGAPMDGCQQQNQGPKLLATVHGEDVTTKEIGIIFNKFNTRNMNDAQLAQERSKALRAAIMLRLLAHEGKKLGLRISEDEFKALMQDPIQNADYRQTYGSDGALNRSLYKNFVTNQLRVPLKEYETFKRREFLARKYLQLAEMQVGALPAQIDEIETRRNTKVKLEYLKLAPADVKDYVTVNDEDVAAFMISKAEDIKKAYEADKDKKYSKAAEYKIRRIYIGKPSSLAPDAEKEAAKKKFEDAKKRAIDGKEDFAKVAGELSETQKKEGGLMGWRTKDNMDASIFKGIEGAKAGEVKPVETDFAYMLVKLEDKKEASVTPLTEVQNDIAKKLLSESRVDAEVKKVMTEVQAKLKTAGTLKAAVKELADAAKPKVDEPAEPADKKPADKKEEDKKEGEKKEEAKTAPKSIWDVVKVNETDFFNLADKSTVMNFQGRQIPIPGPWDSVPGIGKSKEVALAAFKLTKDAPVSETIFDVDGASVLIRLVDRQNPGDAPKEDPKKDPKKDADKEDPAAKKAKERVTIGQTLRGQNLSSLAGGWGAVFGYPAENYGTWLDSMYDNGLTKGQITLNARSSIARNLMPANITIETPDANAPKKGEAPKDDGKKTEKKADKE